MKTLLKILALLIILIVGVLVIGYLNLGRIVTGTVNDIGPKATQSDVSLDGFNLNIFSGEAKLNGLFVGNPEGYKTDSAIKLDEILVKLDPKSLLTDTIHIKQIFINAPELTLEKGLTSDNLKQIQKNIEAFTGATNQTAEVEEETPEATEEKQAKKVIIDELLIQDTKVRVTAKLLQGVAPTITVPEIRLTDIGKDDGGAGIQDVVQIIIGTLFGTITDTLAGGVNLVGDGVGAVGGTAVKGAEAVGDTAVKSVEAVGGTAVKGIENVAKGIGGLLGGKKTNTTNDATSSE